MHLLRPILNRIQIPNKYIFLLKILLKTLSSPANIFSISTHTSLLCFSTNSCDTGITFHQTLDDPSYPRVDQVMQYTYCMYFFKTCLNTYCSVFGFHAHLNSFPHNHHWIQFACALHLESLPPFPPQLTFSTRHSSFPHLCRINNKAIKNYNKERILCFREIVVCLCVGCNIRTCPKDHLT